MSKIVGEVVAANEAYVQTFGKKGDLALPPARQFAILTCMDARLDPAKYAGLAEGDAHVIRNAGGRATDDAIRSLVISHKLLGTQEWFVIHHTNCGMELFSDEVNRRSARGRSVDRELRRQDLVEPAPPRGSCGRPLHQMAYDQEPG
jgi:carbonic anhydrase